MRKEIIDNKRRCVILYGLVMICPRCLIGIKVGWREIEAIPFKHSEKYERALSYAIYSACDGINDNVIMEKSMRDTSA